MIELSELKRDVVISMSNALREKRALTEDEKATAEVLDKVCKDIGNRGSDPDCILSSFIQKTTEPEIFNAPDELLDQLFERGSIGEFDEKNYTVNPENTIEVYDATKGGNVPKSYVDYKTLTPKWYNKQVETSISYTDLRKNGWKTVANLINFIQDALKNNMFFTIMNAVNDSITSSSGDRYIANSSDTLGQAAMDKLSLYLIDHTIDGATPISLSLNKYAQAIANMAGYASYMSDSMKNELNRYGLAHFYKGVQIGGISSAVIVNKQTVLPDKVVFGFAGKIGKLDTRGELRVYQDFDNKKEQIDIKVTGFEFGYMIDKPKNIAKIAVSA